MCLIFALFLPLSVLSPQRYLFFRPLLSLLKPRLLHNALSMTRLNYCPSLSGSEEKFMMHVGLFVFNHCEVIAESCARSLTMRCWSTSWVGNFTQTQEAQRFSPRAGVFAAGTDGPLRLTGAREPAVPTLYCCPGKKASYVDLQGV